MYMIRGIEHPSTKCTFEGIRNYQQDWGAVIPTKRRKHLGVGLEMHTLRRQEQESAVHLPRVVTTLKFSLQTFMNVHFFSTMFVLKYLTTRHPNYVRNYYVRNSVSFSFCIFSFSFLLLFIRGVTWED